jgi:hypothetical protein
MIGRRIEEDQIQTRSRELEKTKKTENYNTRERHREKERDTDRDRDREMVASGGEKNTWERSQRAHGAPGWAAGERASERAPNGQQQRTSKKCILIIS